MKHFLDILGFDADFIHFLIQRSVAFKENRFLSSVLAGKSVALIFDKPSTRTRVSFEVGVQQLGGTSVVLQSDEVGLGKREPIKDFSRVISSYVDMAMIRTFEHERLIECSQFASIPIINGLTDFSHPCQAVADMLTIYETFGSFKGLRCCYIGDANNVTRSLLEICCCLGIEFVLSSPTSQSFNSDLPFKVELDPFKAVSQSHIVYTDTWVSMGESNKTLDMFQPYQVSLELMSNAAKNAIFLHCLPAHRGDEVVDDVIEANFSRVFDQAENRLHAQKSIMEWLVS